MTPDKKARAQAISALIRLGWSPPPPNSEQAQRIIEDIGRLDPRPTLALTERELDVLYLLAEGHDRSEVADRLHVSPDTVKEHTSHVLQKLGARNTTHAVHIADREGLLAA